MAQLKPPLNLSLVGNLAENRRMWLQLLVLFCVASGVAAKSETFLHVPGEEDMKCSEMATAHGSPITTHVLNTGDGVPGAQMALTLHRLDSHLAVWNLLTTGTTNADGRCPGLITREAFLPGMYKMRFETEQYFEGLGQTCFYPYVEIVFTITDPTQKFHLPLLLSRFSYSTYRGS